MLKESMINLPNITSLKKEKDLSSEVWQQKQQIKGKSNDYINETGIIQAKIKILA